MAGAETKDLCFDDSDSLAIDETTLQNLTKILGFDRCRSETLIDLPCLSDEVLGFMVEKERDFLPKDDYFERLRSGDLDSSVRRDAIDWIWKAYVHFEFGELSLCLSISYLDRFLSLYELPRSKAWTVQLLAVACLSLAAKMEEINVPLIVDLQVCETKYVFEGKTIQRMELLVLSTLKWRMQAYTPCTFLDYFLRKLSGDRIPSEPLISRSMQLILSITKGTDFLEFRPSEIAAAVAMFVSREKQANDTDMAVQLHYFFTQVQEDRVVKCLELIQDLTLANTLASPSASSVPQSPNGVLEAGCFSCKSDDRTAGSCPSSSHSTPDTKRRKL